MKIKPLGNRVLVEHPCETEQVKDGIYIPDSAKEKPQLAEVVEVGDAVALLKVGDNVLTSKYGGTEVRAEGRIYVLYYESDILCTVQEN